MFGSGVGCLFVRFGLVFLLKVGWVGSKKLGLVFIRGGAFNGGPLSKLFFCSNFDAFT